MTPAKVELGRHLFYEKRLSITGEMACATCHIQAHAFSDRRSVSVGATGETHPRNAMGLTNVAYSSVLTWANPGQTQLEVQLLVPLFGDHPVEMGMGGHETELLDRLRQDDRYPALFQAAFPSVSQENSSVPPDPITLRNLAKAIAAFERSLVSFNSPYDRYRYGNDPTAIPAAAKRGETLFNSERLECFHCHGGLNFSDSIDHERLATPEIAFHNTGLYNIDGQGAYPPNNTGVHELSHKPQDMGHFKAPSLRNIALTAPYMHDGSIATLSEAIAHYAAGGRSLTSGPYPGIGHQNPLKSGFIQGFTLSNREKQDLLDFLNSLTDPTIVNNPNFSDPNQE